MDGVTFDDALIKHVGQFGPGQWRVLAASSTCLIANAAAFFYMVFATVNPVAQHDWKCSNPSDAACQAVLQQDRPSSQDFCALPAGSTQWTSTESLVARFNLVCADAWKVQFANSLMFMGALVGSGTFGFVCDRVGRRRPLFVATAIIAIAMFVSLAAPSYWVFAALRAVTGFGAAGQSHCNFLISTESVGPGYRGLAGICSLVLFIVGEFVMVALAYALPAWQHLLIACGCINAACVLLYPFVPESGRWLLSQGRVDEARQCLQRIATANKSHVPAGPLVSSHSSVQLASDLEAAAIIPPMLYAVPAVPHQDAAAEKAQTLGDVCRDSSSLSGDESTSDADNSQAEQPATLLQLLRRPRLALRLCILLITSFSVMLNYYGISLGAGGIPGSIYMTFAIGAVAEAVAVSVVAPSVDRIGRHNIVAMGNLLGGAACLACANVAGGATQAALSAVGKFGCAAASSVSSIYIAELLPTSCRSSVMGICSVAMRMGSITAPFLLMLGAQVSVGSHSQVFIPFTVFGCLAVLSGLLVLTMPETLGAAMPESVEDLEKLLSVFEAKPWRKGWHSFFKFVFRTRARGWTPRQSSSQVPQAPIDAASSRSSRSSCGPDALAEIRVVMPTSPVGKKAADDRAQPT